MLAVEGRRDLGHGRRNRDRCRAGAGRNMQIGNNIQTKFARDFKPYPDFFTDLPYFYQIWVNGLDLNRFRAPEHIIEMSNS